MLVADRQTDTVIAILCSPVGDAVTVTKQRLEVDGKPVRKYLGQGTHTQMDGKPQNILPMALSIGWMEAWHS